MRGGGIERGERGKESAKMDLPPYVMPLPIHGNPSTRALDKAAHTDALGVQCVHVVEVRTIATSFKLAAFMLFMPAACI